MTSTSLRRSNEPRLGEGARPPPASTGLLLAALAVPIAFLALGAHDFALTRLHVPYPDEVDVPSWVRLVGRAVRVGALVVLCRCGGGFLERRGPIAAILIVGAVNAALGETLRLIVINDQIYGGGWGSNLLYSLTDQAPSGMLAFYEGAAAAAVARFAPRGVSLAAVAAVAIAAAFGMYAVSPAFKAAMGAVAAAAHLRAPTPVYGMPFGFHMYKYIYATFLEPTFASLVLAYIVWPGLPGGRAARIGLYTLLFLLARGRIYAIAVNAFWVRYPWPVAVAAEGQFFAESLILAVLTGAAVEHISGRPLRKRRRAEGVGSRPEGPTLPRPADDQTPSGG